MTTTFKASLIDLAQDIALRAKAQDEEGNRTPFIERIDALKALTQLYTAMQKHPDDADDTRDGFNFEDGLNGPKKEPPDGGTVTPISTGQRRRPG